MGLLRHAVIFLLIGLLPPWGHAAEGRFPSRTAALPTVDLPARLAGIARLAAPSPMVPIAAGWFLLGTNRKDDDPYGFETQFDDTELPQKRVWLDAYAIDRDEVSLGEFLADLRARRREPSDLLERLIHHMITVHAATDDGLARWPALYVTWAEAEEFCHARGKRLPTEAEWEKAARGTEGNLFPWGRQAPDTALAVYGQYHVHEIPLVAPVNSGEAGRSPFGLHHMAGNAAEWVGDWFGNDYYASMPDRNPPGPSTGRYKSVRGGSWKSKPHMLRTATRGGALPEQRAATIGFRCAMSDRSSGRPAAPPLGSP
jgi:iron(II)-dependent oxidoreductase